MKRLTHNIVSGGSYLGWHLHLLEDDEQQLQLLPALDAESPPRFWDSNKIIPMELTVTRVFADQNLDIPNPLGEELVAVSKPDGSEWKPLLNWLAVGGFYKPIAGPPRNNPRMIRIVSPALKSAMGRFYMPPHRFYPVRVRHELTGEERDYFMFHLLGDLEMEEMEAFWPAMKFYVYEEQSPFEKKPRKTIRNYPPGAVTNLQEYVEVFRSFFGEYEFDKINISFPYLIYQEPYDLVWGKGWMAMSAEMGSTLLETFGREVVGSWKSDDKPIITGFDPARDALPDDLLSM